MAALECLRDIGLEGECHEYATKSENMEHTRWCYSMAGEEYARIPSWGHDPHRHGDYADASPCQHVDLPQTLAEPIMVNRAKQRGWDVRFDTTLLSFDDQLDNGVVSELKDNKNGRVYKIRSQFLFGCDGARSQVVRQLGLPLIKKPGQGFAINVLVECDLSHLIKTRNGNLHWTIQPTKPYPGWGWIAIVRMVKPWHEWMFILFPHPTHEITPENEPTQEEYLSRCRDFIGDDSIDAKIISISKWTINEIVAEQYSSESKNIHCLGDAVHRHPPFNGLGSNTCIQDAYNLAWKVALVMQGKADKNHLLESYSVERQPVGLGVITRANQGLRDHLAVWEALGLMDPTIEQRTKAHEELAASSSAGAKRRRDLRTAVKETRREFHAVGQEMNQRYDGSKAIYFADESGPRPPLPDDPLLYHQISSYPGARLPHAWLNTRNPGEQFSTQDLAGKGRFTLLTGPGDGDGKWKAAAEAASVELGVDVKSFSIGWKQEYEDVYGDWAQRSEVDDDGCVLVRPDRFVAWRSKGMVEDPKGRLTKVLKSILGKL